MLVGGFSALMQARLALAVGRLSRHRPLVKLLLLPVPVRRRRSRRHLLLGLLLLLLLLGGGLGLGLLTGPHDSLLPLLLRLRHLLLLLYLGRCHRSFRLLPCALQTHRNPPLSNDQRGRSW